MEIKQLDFSYQPINRELNKGNFIWCPEILDFEPLAVLGQKLPTTKGEFEVNVNVNNGQIAIQHNFDYHGLRVILILLEGQKNIIKQLLSILERLNNQSGELFSLKEIGLIKKIKEVI